MTKHKNHSINLLPAFGGLALLGLLTLATGCETGGGAYSTTVRDTAGLRDFEVVVVTTPQVPFEVTERLLNGVRITKASSATRGARTLAKWAKLELPELDAERAEIGIQIRTTDGNALDVDDFVVEIPERFEEYRSGVLTPADLDDLDKLVDAASRPRGI